MEEIVRKSRKDKYIASQKIEIGETSVESPELTAPITTEDGISHKQNYSRKVEEHQVIEAYLLHLAYYMIQALVYT